MKTRLMTTIASLAMLTATASSQATAQAQNPFFVEWTTPFGVPPFGEIKPEHFIPAFEEGIRQHKAEVEAIINNTAALTFDNVVVAYDNAGELLDKVNSVFGCLTGTDITPELESIQQQISPMLTSHRSDLSLNPKLFAKVKAIYDQRKSLNLNAAQSRLLDKLYKGFERGGANLSDSDKAKLRELDQQLSKLSLSFGRNLRNDNGAFALVIDNQADLTGLPESVKTAAAAEAKSRSMEGKWVFTLDKPSLIPFLQYADNRSLREQLYKGYLERCNHGNANDNKAVLDAIANLRIERANLLGFDNHASYVLDRNMAKDPKAVYALLEELWSPALKLAGKELNEMKAIKVKEGQGEDFQSWDWWYYAEKVRKEKYNLDEEMLRPYFALNNVLDGIFDLTTKLYGITYRPLADVPTYNTENQVFEVLDKDGSHLGVVYFDFHPRASKRVGAWCTRFRGQSYKDGNKVTPVVSIVCNFTKPAGNEPALLNLDEVETLFHEYGHGLHSLFCDVPYQSLAGVERDFVELPSQIMENWAFEPSVLAMYAKHYKTGEVIPANLVEKIQNSSLFNQGFATVEYLGASLLDMDYHTQTKSEKRDIAQFEQQSLSKFGLMPEIAPRYRSTYFQHIFSGGYSSGYYAYIWAEVLDSDAFEAFRESGNLFDPTVAAAFREHILSKGGTSEGGVLYQNFRGKEPKKEPLMKRRGLI